MENLLQPVVWHIEEYALGYLCALLICALCLGVWAARRRQRNILRRLLGDAFLRTRSYVETGSGIAVDGPLARFAISRGRKGAICTFSDVTEMKFNPPTSSSFATELVLETTHPDIPRLDLSSLVRSERLGDIHGQLTAMQKKNAPLQTRSDPNKSDDVMLADAIIKLASAVTAITNVMIDRFPCPDYQSGSKQARDTLFAYPDRDPRAFSDPSSRRLPGLP